MDMKKQEERVPKIWDRVRVRDGGDNERGYAIYLATIEWRRYGRHLCVDWEYEEEFKKWEEFEIERRTEMKKLEKLEVTLEEIADKFGVGVSDLKIKK